MAESTETSIEAIVRRFLNLTHDKLPEVSSHHYGRDEKEVSPKCEDELTQPSPAAEEFDDLEQLIQKFTNLSSPSEDIEERESTLLKLVHDKFEKAVSDAKFIPDFSEMTCRLCHGTSEEVAKKFRKVILDHCQQEFVKSIAEKKEIEKRIRQVKNAKTVTIEIYELSVEVDERKFHRTRRIHGIVEVIMELYKLNLITFTIIAGVVDNLLLFAAETPDEKNVKALCELMALLAMNKYTEDEVDDFDYKTHKCVKVKGQPSSGETRSRTQLRAVRKAFIPNDTWAESVLKKLAILSQDEKLSRRIRISLLFLAGWLKESWDGINGNLYGQPSHRLDRQLNLIIKIYEEEIGDSGAIMYRVLELEDFYFEQEKFVPLNIVQRKYADKLKAEIVVHYQDLFNKAKVYEDLDSTFQSWFGRIMGGWSDIYDLQYLWRDILARPWRYLHQTYYSISGHYFNRGRIWGNRW